MKESPALTRKNSSDFPNIRRGVSYTVLSMDEGNDPA